MEDLKEYWRRKEKEIVNIKIVCKCKEESPRTKQIRENNERSRNEGLKIVAKGRHARRHEGKKGTTLKERSEWIKKMSKD
jgi:hypothetical protein